MKTAFKCLVSVLGLGLSAGLLQVRAADASSTPATPKASDSAAPQKGGPANAPGNRGARGQQPGRGGRGGAADPAARVQRLDMALKLTDDQKSRITAIYKDADEEMAALQATVQGNGGRAGRGGRGGDVVSATVDNKAVTEARAKLAAVQSSVKAKVRAVLTDDQQKKFDAMPDPAAPGAGGGRGGPGGAGGPRGGRAGGAPKAGN